MNFLSQFSYFLNVWPYTSSRLGFFLQTVWLGGTFLPSLSAPGGLHQNQWARNSSAHCRVLSKDSQLHIKGLTLLPQEPGNIETDSNGKWNHSIIHSFIHLSKQHFLITSVLRARDPKMNKAISNQGPESERYSIQCCFRLPEHLSPTPLSLGSATIMTAARGRKETNLIEKQSFQPLLPWWLIETHVFLFFYPKGKINTLKMMKALQSGDWTWT